MVVSRRTTQSLAVAALVYAATLPSDVEAQVSTWSVGSTPTARIGAREGADEILSAPAGATRLPSGNVVVGDLGDWALREFSPEGALVKRYGRKGKGPGEVSYLAPLLRCGDSLVTNDIAGSQLSVFSQSGTFTRAFRIKAPIYRVNCNARMQFIVMGWETKPVMNAGVHRPLYPYFIARADSLAPVSLGDLPGSERFGPRPYPLGREPRVAIGPRRAYIALADSFEVRVFDLSGKALASLTAKVPRIAATQADLTAEREREIAMLGERARAATERDYATMPLPAFLPATRDIVVDADANVWVQHFPRATSPTVQWTIFSEAGALRATVALPSALEVYEVGRDYVLGRYIDPNESIPEVRLYRLTKR